MSKARPQSAMRRFRRERFHTSGFEKGYKKVPKINSPKINTTEGEKNWLL